MTKEDEPNRRVLVVEDNESWGRSLERLVKERGYEAVPATSAEKAIGLIKDSAYYRVITDGLEGEWRKVCMAAQEKGVKIIVISGNMHVGSAVKKEGFDFIDKLSSTPTWEKLIIEHLD